MRRPQHRSTKNGVVQRHEARAEGAKPQAPLLNHRHDERFKTRVKEYAQVIKGF